jgi:hypothetical protein
MKKTNQILLAGSALALVTVLGLTLMTESARAYRGDPAVKGPNYSAERHAAMEKAFENKDYNAWKELMQGRGRVTSIITSDNFARFAEAHELAEAGKYAEADAIRKELGLPTKDQLQGRGGLGRGQGGFGRHCQR